MRKTVDLPEPLGPTRPTFSPRKTLIEASRKRICRPCCFEIESRRITLPPDAPVTHVRLAEVVAGRVGHDHLGPRVAAEDDRVLAEDAPERERLVAIHP